MWGFTDADNVRIVTVIFRVAVFAFTPVYEHLFFFFKQKTAYELGQCWSSDVCSSDLVLPMPGQVAVEPLEIRLRVALRG